LREETGVEARLTGLIDVVDGLFPEAGLHYVLIDYAAEWLAGEPAAGDDAAEAQFISIREAMGRVQWHETRRVIADAVSFRGLEARAELAIENASRRTTCPPEGEPHP
jgi:8-oxo-dGTP diphosphatase